MKLAAGNPNLTRVQFLYRNVPTAFTYRGEYAIGLATLFGAHLCWNDKEHTFVDNKCTACPVERKFV